MKNLTPFEANQLAAILAKKAWNFIPRMGPILKCFGIPRGGVHVAKLVFEVSEHTIQIAQNPSDADFFVDDVIESGATMQHWSDAYPGKPFFALIDKTDPESPFREDWVKFPWESDELADPSNDDTIVGTLTNRIKKAGAAFHANDNISDFIHSETEMVMLQDELSKRAEHFLRGLIIDVDNDHNTKETAARIAKLYIREAFKGRYLPAPKSTSFPNAKNLDEMYVTGPITIRSACSHHFAPILGKCWIGVVPGEKLIGLSKFNRIVDWFASRGQIQEELAVQIADFIEQEIAPKGLAVFIEATHTCMTWRGVREPMDAKMTTSVMRGAFRNQPEARAEFLTIVSK